MERAPSLDRGLRLLALLGREGGCTLERLARLGGWPKSSTLRLLHVLATHGAVSRDGRRWRAQVGLVPHGCEDVELCRTWSGVVAELAEDTGCTVELHRFTGSSHVLIDRADPPEDGPGPVARVGYLRPADEADAVTVTAWAAGERLPRATKRVGPDGPVLWPAAARTRAIAACRRDGYSLDIEPNPSDIRRLAVGILVDGRHRGALAIACTGKLPLDRLRRLLAWMQRRPQSGDATST